MNVLQKNRINKVGIDRLEMSNRLGVSERTIKAWEEETRYIKTVDLVEVGRAYKLTLLDLFKYLKQADKQKSINYNL